jgi:predicted enzyme related to lactoylglutathione lyase
MPAHDSYPLGAPCWVDLATSDTGRSRDFYCELFGWTADEPIEQLGGYFNFRKDGVLVGGCMAAQPGTPDVWSVYLTTDDAEKTVDAAVADGGRVVVPPMPVAGLGTMAVVTDPGGAAVGLWQPGSHQGMGAIGQAGTPSWFELHTRDYDAAVAFYPDVFRCETQTVGDEAGFRYTTLVHGGEMLAGIMDATQFLPEGAPAQWSVYLGVDDADATLARTVELGGSIDTPAEDTPYGRLAVAADPTGARFKLVAPNEDMPAR